MPPLYEQLRPISFKEIAGQDHIVSDKGILYRIINSKKPISILLVGPPGSGKTTIARLYSKAFGSNFKTLNASFSGISDIKKIIFEIKKTPLFNKIIFVDEIHRFNKAKQDVFLPYLEDGSIVLVGATTENPSFSINNALLSRFTLLTLHSLSLKDLNKIIKQYEKNFKPLPLGDDEKKYLIKISNGDGRYLTFQS